MNNTIVIIMLLFTILGGIDRLLGNRYGLGERFEEGFKAMGPLALSMIGIISLAPVIGQFSQPILTYIYKVTGVDPAILISSFLSLDMGGYAIANQVAQNEVMGQYAGIILASMMGSTISFTIPIALNIISREDFPYFTKGILAGVITIPVGMIAGGIMLKIPLRLMGLNMLPVVLLGLVIVIGLLRFERQTMRIFNIFGRGIMIVSSTAMLLSILDFALGIKIIPGMAPYEEGLIIVGNIGIFLAGAYPLFYIIRQLSKDKLNSLGEKLAMNEFAVIGLLSSLANCIPSFAIYNKMDRRGQVVNAAFAVSGAFVFGGQLGYVADVAPELIGPIIISKLLAGLAGALLANLLFTIDRKKINLEEI